MIGGQRPGAGRKRKDPSGERRVSASFSVTPSEKQWLEDQLAKYRSGTWVCPEWPPTDSRINAHNATQEPRAAILKPGCVSEVGKTPRVTQKRQGVARNAIHVNAPSGVGKQVAKKPISAITDQQSPETGLIGGPRGREKAVKAKAEAPVTCGRGNPLKCSCLKCRAYRDWLYAD